MTTTESSVVSVLTEARGRIRRGWCQEVTTQGHGAEREFCALGAIECSTDSRKRISIASDFLRKVIEEDSITEWNDAPERTQQEVLDAFSRAIELARQEEAAK